jgi:hypothetical protein
MESAQIASQRKIVLIGAAIIFPFMAALWLAVYFLLPPLPGMADPLARLVFALGCSCIAVLLCFVTGIEAIAHERLFSPAIDPLAGYETRQMKVNFRYLQQTLEQLMVFIPGLLALAYYCPDGSSMRAVAAVTAVWIASRFAFWIGYHYSPLYRIGGGPGMLQSMAVLLYVCARFGYDFAGLAGALAPLILFGCIEAYLFYVSRPAA